MRTFYSYAVMLGGIGGVWRTRAMYVEWRTRAMYGEWRTRAMYGGVNNEGDV